MAKTLSAGRYFGVKIPSGPTASNPQRKRKSHVVKKHSRTLPSGKTVKVKRHRRSKKKG